MVKILILDQDILYCRRVCAQINLKSSDYMCYNQSDYNNGSPLLTDLSNCEHIDIHQEIINLCSYEISWNSTLVIYNPDQFYNPPDESNSIMLTEISMSDNLAFNENSICRIDKYCSLTIMMDRINTYLQNHPALLPVVQEGRLICVLGAACPLLRMREIDTIIQEKLGKGLKVVRLDLCPPYFSGFPISESAGYTLSDAFLRLMADDLSYDDFGLFLVSRADGSLQFRPIERADDLFECKPDHFRKFVGLLHNWIINTNYQYVVIINCYAIPFSSVYAIAVLCDQLILLNQDKTSSKTNSYNKELSYLLPNLPNTCEVHESLLVCAEIK